MRLQFNPLNEIFFRKIQDDRMKGNVQMINPTSDTIFSFKIKCTNPELFTVNPLKGQLKAGQNINIQFTTVDSVNLDFARQLVSKHKFLIEFVPIVSQKSLPNFRSQESDRKKFYINMDSIRGSKLFKDSEKISIQSAVSNKLSYISMKNEDQKPNRGRQFNTPRIFGDTKTSSPSPRKNSHQNLNEKYSSLKNELEDLHRQRQQMLNELSSGKRSTSNNIKKIVVFILFVIIGIVLGNKVERIIEQRRIQEEQRKRKQSSKPWRLFGFLDFLYDEVDPNDL